MICDACNNTLHEISTSICDHTISPTQAAQSAATHENAHFLALEALGYAMTSGSKSYATQHANSQGAKDHRLEAHPEFGM